MICSVEVKNESAGFSWEGTVDPQGQVTEASGGGTGTEVIGWYGYIVGLTPEEGQFDDYLVLMPEGAGEVGVEGIDEAVQAQIVALRDAEEPGKYASFWGTLTCDVVDYGGCQLLATKLRVDGPGPFFEPDEVDGWVGTIASVENWAPGMYEDYFVLEGDFAVRFGVDGDSEQLDDQIESLRDSGTKVRISGQIECGVPDVNAAHIVVMQIDVVG